MDSCVPAGGPRGPGAQPPAGLVSLSCNKDDASTSGRVIVLDARAARLRRMRRRVRGWARWARGLRRFYWCVGVDLTYAPGQDWEPNDVRAFVRHFRRQAVAHCWVAELQERGAVHFHVILVLPRGRRIPFPDQGGLWKKGMTRTKYLPWRKIGDYLAEYVRKLDQKMGPFPRGLRIFGVGFTEVAWRILGEEARLWFRASGLPGWLVALVDWLREIPARFGAGGWWWFRRASIWVRSPWRLYLRYEGWIYLEYLGAIGFSFVAPTGAREGTPAEASREGSAPPAAPSWRQLVLPLI